MRIGHLECLILDPLGAKERGLVWDGNDPRGRECCKTMKALNNNIRCSVLSDTRVMFAIALSRFGGYFQHVSIKAYLEGAETMPSLVKELAQTRVGQKSWFLRPKHIFFRI